MKQKLFSLGFFLLLNFGMVFCQGISNEKFPILWQNHTLILTVSGPGQVNYDYYYQNFYLLSDSVVRHDTIFRKIFWSYDKYFNPQNLTFFKYITEVNKKVFLSDSMLDLKLVLDYNLQVADSFCFVATNPFWLKVKSIDSVMIGNTKRKRLTFDSLPGRQDLVWVEGIGDVTYGQHFTGYQNLIQFNFFYQGLDCYTENNNYLLGDYCRISDIQESDINNENFVVYPNPTDGLIKFSLKQNTNVEYSIYNAFGGLMQKGLLHGLNEINIMDFKRGLYFLQLGNDRSKVYKIVKE